MSCCTWALHKSVRLRPGGKRLVSMFSAVVSDLKWEEKKLKAIISLGSCLQQADHFAQGR